MIDDIIDELCHVCEKWSNRLELIDVFVNMIQGTGFVGSFEKWWICEFCWEQIRWFHGVN